MWMLLFFIFSLAILTKITGIGFDALTVYLSRTLLVSAGPAKFLAESLVFSEAVIACLLLWPRTRSWGLMLAGGLACGFLVFHICELFAGEIEPCPCFGRFLPTALAGHVGMAVLSMVIVSIAALALKQRMKLAA